MERAYACHDKFRDVVEALDARGWTRVNSCDSKRAPCSSTSTSTNPALLWVNLRDVDFRSLGASQYVNHLKGAQHLSNKALLTGHLDYSRAKGDNPDWFFPRCWNMGTSSAESWIRYYAVCQAVTCLQKRDISPPCNSSLELVQRYIRHLRAGGLGHDMTDAVVNASGEELWAAMGIGQNLAQSCSIDECNLAIEELGRLDPQWDLMGAGRNLWIVKPAGLACGRGIEVFDDIQGVIRAVAALKYKAVVQKYIERPLLLHGHKFDIRQWVMVTSVNPLIAWGFSENYARLSTSKFSLSHDKLGDRMIHLCNYSVQKDGDEGELMWEGRRLQSHINQHHGEDGEDGEEDVYKSRVLPSIRRAVLASLKAAIGAGELTKRSKGFEWLGYDFILTHELKVMLLEVNVSPDVSHSTAVTSSLVAAATADALALCIDERHAAHGCSSLNRERVDLDLFSPPSTVTMLSKAHSQDPSQDSQDPCAANSQNPEGRSLGHVGQGGESVPLWQLWHWGAKQERSVLERGKSNGRAWREKKIGGRSSAEVEKTLTAALA
ncbi:unnamed protein product [Chrysoparadoxa australica]